MFIYMHASNKSFICGSAHYLNDTIRFEVPSKGKDEEYHGISSNEEPCGFCLKLGILLYRL